MNDDSPTLLSFNFDPGPSIYRTETIKISAAFDDDIQKQDDLSVEMEYRLPGQEMWTTLSNDGPFFNESKWVWEIHTQAYTAIGNWNIRIICQDMMREHPEMIFEAGSFKVLNNQPFAPEINLIVERPTTTDDITVAVSEGTGDIETPFEELLFTYEWWVDDEIFTFIENTTHTTSTINHGDTYKGQVWRILVSSWDGNEKSSISVIDVKVENTEPRIKDPPLRPITIFEDDRTTSFRPSDLILDQDGDDLEYMVTPREGLDLSKVGEDYLILPDKDWSGTSGIDLKARDGSGYIDLNISVEVIPVNDRPEGVKIISPMNRTIVGAGYKWHFLGKFNDPDLPYGQKINCSWEINGEYIGNGLELNGFILPPGTHQVTFIVDDTFGETIIDTVVLIVLGSIDQRPEQDSPIEEIAVTDDEMDEVASYIFIISVILFFLLVGILLFAILRKSKVRSLKGKYLPAPLLHDHIMDKKKENRQYNYRSRDAVPPQLPPIASERKKIGQWEKLMSRQRKWRRRKADRYSQNGRKIGVKKLERDETYNPYSTTTIRGSEGVEKLAEYDSFYIRPEKPYRY
jgi:hypothetical protein